jgi:hypothetical protein
VIIGGGQPSDQSKSDQIKVNQSESSFFPFACQPFVCRNFRHRESNQTQLRAESPISFAGSVALLPSTLQTPDQGKSG